MARRYITTFQFFDTEDQAREFCNRENMNRYIKQHHKAHYTPWSSKDGRENKFVAWYVTK